MRYPKQFEIFANNYPEEIKKYLIASDQSAHNLAVEAWDAAIEFMESKTCICGGSKEKTKMFYAYAQPFVDAHTKKPYINILYSCFSDLEGYERVPEFDREKK